MNSKEQGQQEMQEGDPKSDNKLNKGSSSSRSHWGGFRNPRIVRVSRSFGGKDRHSKVCTVRGLRDRRIRLSVPTAIQLYGLQDKLGLSQPSKVVDWLLDATKNDIDKLPPLQMPPGSLGQFFNPLLASSSSLPYFFNQNTSSPSSSSYVKDGIKINDQVHGNDDQTMMDNRSKYCIPQGDSSSNIKLQGEKDKWINGQENLEGYNASQITAQNFFPILNQSSLTSSLPYNHPYYQLEANYSNLSLSQFGSNIIPNQVENQLYFYPSSTTTAIPAIVNPPLSSFTTMENSSDPSRQFNHFQFLNSTSQHLLPNPLFPTLHFISSPMKSHLFKNLDHQESDKNEGGSGS